MDRQDKGTIEEQAPVASREIPSVPTIQMTKSEGDNFLRALLEETHRTYGDSDIDPARPR